MYKTNISQGFVIGGSVSAYNIIGREVEIRQLKMNFERGGYDTDFTTTMGKDLIGEKSVLGSG